jgi:hypothetical protein
MSRERAVVAARVRRGTRSLAVLALTLACSSPEERAGDGGACFPDADGVTGGSYTIDLTVDDDGFSKRVLDTQNDSTVTLTLTNAGSLPHGFELECVDVTPEYPKLPAGCPPVTCFPDASTIGPLMPGESHAVTFVTPATDNLIYPFKSSAPDDATVPSLNEGQWSLM